MTTTTTTVPTSSGIIKRMRIHKAIWWEETGRDTFGRQTFAAPRTIACRWDDVVSLDVLPNGEEYESFATVYVDRVLKEGDYLKLGEVVGATPASPLADRDAYEIKVYSETRKLRQEIYLYTCKL
jgi:hypothetical protein